MANLGYTILGAFVFCSIGGYYADQKFGTGYLWTFIGIGTAITLTAYELWKLLRKKQ